MLQQLATKAVDALIDKAEDVIEDVIDEAAEQVEDHKDTIYNAVCKWIAHKTQNHIKHVGFAIMACGIYAYANATNDDKVDIDINDTNIVQNVTMKEALQIIYNIMTS